MTRCAAPTFPSGWLKDPNAVVFLAMSQHRLGRLAEAKEGFSRVKKLINDPQTPSFYLDKDFLDEAERLIGAHYIDPHLFVHPTDAKPIMGNRFGVFCCG